jgi:hypothetical protein
LDRLARVCVLGLGLVTVPLVGETVLGGSPGWSCWSVRWRSARAEMFVLATINAPSWRRTMARWSTSGTS